MHRDTKKKRQSNRERKPTTRDVSKKKQVLREEEEHVEEDVAEDIEEDESWNIVEKKRKKPKKEISKKEDIEEEAVETEKKKKPRTAGRKSKITLTPAQQREVMNELTEKFPRHHLFFIMNVLEACDYDAALSTKVMKKKSLFVCVCLAFLVQQRLIQHLQQHTLTPMKRFQQHQSNNSNQTTSLHQTSSFCFSPHIVGFGGIR